MQYVNLLIKPASSLCNMRCTYCFYADESEHRMQKSMGVMSSETAEKLIDAAFSALDGRGGISFSFQGGEPTVAGLSFFCDFVEMVRDRNEKQVPVHYAIQTNGLNIDAQWAQFLKKNRFLVGVSLDGDRAVHDSFRFDGQGRGTYDRATDAVRLLMRTGVDTNLLCVVNGRTAAKPKQIYRSLKALKTGYLQFIPCLDPMEVPRGCMHWSLTPDLYGSFLCAVFDEWYKDWAKGQYVSVRLFDDWVHAAMGLPPGMCATCGKCGGYLVSEADGSLYPCDFYVLDEWKLGTVEDDLNAVLRSEKMKAFRHRSMGKPTDCRTCPYYPICQGGCPRDWDRTGGEIRNYFCPSFRMLFSYAEKRILQMAQAEIAARHAMRG